MICYYTIILRIVKALPKLRLKSYVYKNSISHKHSENMSKIRLKSKKLH